MNQEETTKNNDSDENTINLSQENTNNEEIAADSEEVDNLPIESIGSYGRIEPLMSDETENPEEGDIER